MERIFRELKDSEIRVVKPTMIELKSEDGWLITESDKSLQTETTLVCLPNIDLVANYCCVNKIEEEIIESII